MSRRALGVVCTRIASRLDDGEAVTLRYGRLRDCDGKVYFVPNGTISTVINMTRGFANAVVDIGVGYSADLDQVMDVMRGVGDDLRQDPAFAAQILQDLDIAGVQDWAGSAIMIRARLQVVASHQWAVRREYLRRLKRAFDTHGIEIPFLQMTVHQAPGPAARGTQLPGGGGAVSTAASGPARGTGSA